ncbi:MAG: hypothetical protein ACKOT0_03435 [bacterium]
MMPASVAPGAGVLQIVGHGPDGGMRAISIGMTVETEPAAVSITARRAGQRDGGLVVVEGQAWGLSSASATAHVRIGRGSRAKVIERTVVVSSSGRFTFRVRTQDRVRIHVVIDETRSNAVTVGAVRRTS